MINIIGNCNCKNSLRNEAYIASEFNTQRMWELRPLYCVTITKSCIFLWFVGLR
nr:MAG TPA: hypothetical protein [Caudoviricetes sp.]